MTSSQQGGMLALVGSIRAALGQQESELEQLQGEAEALRDDLKSTDNHNDKLRSELLTFCADVARLP